MRSLKFRKKIECFTNSYVIDAKLKEYLKITKKVQIAKNVASDRCKNSHVTAQYHSLRKLTETVCRRAERITQSSLTENRFVFGKNSEAREATLAFKIIT